MATMPCGEPDRLLCPLTKVMFQDPVFTEAGNTYEHSAIRELWQRREDFFDPLFNKILRDGTLRPNWDKRREIQDFLSEYRSYVPEGWESRSVPAAVADQGTATNEQSHAWNLPVASCPKRRWIRIIVMILASVAGAVGALVVEVACLGNVMDDVRGCTALELVTSRVSPWVVAPVSVVIGGFLFGAVFGIVAAVVGLGHIAMLWLMQLFPALAAYGVARLSRRGAQAQLESHRQAEARAQARTQAQHHAQVQARTLAMAALNQSQQSAGSQAISETVVGERGVEDAAA